MTKAMQILEHDGSRLAEIATLFTASVHQLATAHYDAAQREAWAPRPPDPAQWQNRLQHACTLLADEDGSLLGFLAFEARGHVDMLFTLPGAARRGVATRLYREAEKRLRASGVAELTTEASRVAEPFFAREGFTVCERQRVERGGQWFERALMRKRLAA